VTCVNIEDDIEMRIIGRKPISFEQLEVFVLGYSRLRARRDTRILGLAMKPDSNHCEDFMEESHFGTLRLEVSSRGSYRAQGDLFRGFKGPQHCVYPNWIAWGTRASSMLYPERALGNVLRQGQMKGFIRKM